MLGVTVRQYVPEEEMRKLCLVSRAYFEKRFGIKDFMTYVHQGQEEISITHNYYNDEHEKFNNDLIQLYNKLDFKYPFSYPNVENQQLCLTFVNMNARNYKEIPSIEIQPDATFQMYMPLHDTMSKKNVEVEKLRELFLNNRVDESHRAMLESLLKNIPDTAFVSKVLKRNIASAVFNICGGPLDVLQFEFDDWNNWTKAPSQHGLKYLIKLGMKYNPQGTREHLQNNVEHLVLQAVQPGASDREVAMVLYIYTVGKYIKSTNCWFMFNKTYWKEIEEPTSIRNILADVVRPKFKQLKFDLLNKNKNELLGKTTKIIEKLGENRYKNNILKELADMLFDQEFEYKLNKKRHLFSFNNKIYDASTGEIRDGHPDDMLSKTCEYDYEEFSWDHPDVKWWFDTYIDKVYPADYFTFNGKPVYTKEGGRIKFDLGQDVYEYSRKELDSGFQQVKLGHISDCKPCYETREFSMRRFGISLGNGSLLKDVVIAQGKTNGGKSMQDKILRLMHGQWAANFPHALLFDDKVQKSNAHGPTTGFESLRDAKYASITELPKGGKIVSSMLKILVSGGVDGIFSRDCNQKAKSALKNKMVVYAMLMFFVNDIPLVDGDDSAIEDRLWIQFYQAVFDRCAPKDLTLQKIKQHYPRDDSLSLIVKQKIASWTWIVIQYHREYLKDKQLIIPEMVKLRTKLYMVQNDPVQSFINSTFDVVPQDNMTYYKYVEKCRDKKISVIAVYKNYTAWFQQKHSMSDKEKPLTLEQFNVKMQNKNFIIDKKSYIGLSYKSVEA